MNQKRIKSKKTVLCRYKVTQDFPVHIMYRGEKYDLGKFVLFVHNTYMYTRHNYVDTMVAA